MITERNWCYLMHLIYMYAEHVTLFFTIVLNNRDKYYCTELENANMHNFQRQFNHIEQCTLICKKYATAADYLSVQYC